MSIIPNEELDKIVGILEELELAARTGELDSIAIMATYSGHDQAFIVGVKEDLVSTISYAMVGNYELFVKAALIADSIRKSNNNKSQDNE